MKKSVTKPVEEVLYMATVAQESMLGFVPSFEIPQFILRETEYEISNPRLFFELN